MEIFMRKEMFFHVAEYIRLSRDDGDKTESNSISNQKKFLADYIKERDALLVYDIYIDDGFSGTNYERPAFRRMINDIEAGKVNCVIVKDLSRFGRDYIDTGRYLERYFPERNVRFISITDNIDSFAQAYDMLLPIKNIFNEQYARDISRKIHASVLTKQKAGEFIGAIHFVPQNAVDGRIAPVGNAVRMVGISVMLAVCVFIGGRAEDAFFV